MELLRILPKNTLSSWVGRAAGYRSPGAFARGLRDWFIKRYKINMNEAELPLESYPTLSDLFIRKLKPGMRPISSSQFVHPCDSRITVADGVSSGQLIQAKGRSYDLKTFLQDDKAESTFVGGSQIIYYLCPTDYHRVHSPVDGFVTEVISVPGQLWPVNDWSVQSIDQLFSVNERVVFRIQTAQGPLALVMVGATNVGQISVSFDSEIRTNQLNQARQVVRKMYKPEVALKKGQELGIFHMGSTVILIAARGVIEGLPQLGAVKMGQGLSGADRVRLNEG